VESTGAGAWFAFSDTNSQGNWAGVYGQEGYVVAGDSTNTPTYALANVGSQLVIWATNTTDPRGLQRASGSSALSSAWYDFTNLVFDVEFTDATFHRLSLYSVDWLNLGGTETVDVLDFVSGRVLDHRLVQPFASGIFNVWDAQGHLGFRLTRPAGAPAMVSGLFFDVSPVLPSIIITNPPDGAFFAAPANITVTADSPADPIISRVDFYEGGSLVGSASNGPPYTFLWSNVPAGTRFLTAREVSKFGTADSAPIRLTIVASNVSVLAGPNLLADGSLQLNAFGPPGQPFRLEAATNLGPNAFWVPLATNTSGSNPFNFIVPDPTNYPQRFYRTVTLP